MRDLLFKGLTGIIIVLIFIITTNAQTEKSADDEVIKVQTNVTQIAVSTFVPYKNLRWELTNNEKSVKDFTIDAPETSRMGLIILVLRTDPNTKVFSDRAKIINNRFKSLEKDLNLAAPPTVVSYSADCESDLKYPAKWNIQIADSANGAISDAIAALQTNASSRRALLIISDAKESVPRDILTKTDLRLLKQSALVFYLGVAIEKAGKNKKTIVSRSNLPGGKLTILGGDYVGGLLNFFIQIANTTYVLSFQSEANDPSSQVNAFVYDERNEVIGRNSRLIQVNSDVASKEVVK